MFKNLSSHYFYGFCFFLIIIFPWKTYGQSIISGQITSEEGDPLSRINVLIYLPDNSTLVSFGITDTEGKFTASVVHLSDSLVLVVRSINYSNEMCSIKNATQSRNFVLTEEVKEIKGVTVEAPMIERRGDTLSFLISSFAGKEDMVLQDVLKKMPGIEIESNGRILYQGLPLRKFYIEGLDLMDGRYNVISENLPHQSVSAVEIMENHQPIKILEDKISSHQASINIKLKNDIAVTGSAIGGAGLYPMLWDVNITPMFFTKKAQVVASFQSNNVGRDVAENLNILTYNDAINKFDRPNESPTIIGIQQASEPTLEKRRYIDNVSYLGNMNVLTKLSNEFQLRANLYYINDKQNKEAVTHRTILLPGDTFSFTEQYHNKYHENYLLGIVTLSRNAKNNYFDNTLKVRSRWDEFSGVVNNNMGVVEQYNNSPLQSISNEMKSVNAIGKYLVDLNSYISYDNSLPTLTVTPGSFTSIFSDSLDYNKIIQNIDLKRLYTDNNASIIMTVKRIMITPKVGIIYRNQNLGSSILTNSSNDDVLMASERFANDLTTTQLKAYAKTNIEYKYRQFTLNASLPFSWQKIIFSDPGNQVDTLMKVLYFDPSIYAGIKFSKFWKVRVSARQSHTLGDLDDHYYGIILNNYRRLSKKAAPLQQSTRKSASLYVSYNNIISSFLSSCTYIFGHSENSLLYGNFINDDGTAVMTAYEKPNTRISQMLKLSASKYFTNIKSTIRLDGNFSLQSGTSLINDALFSSLNRMMMITPACNVRLTSWFTVEYKLNTTYIESFVESKKSNDISMLRHGVELFAFPGRDHLISLSGEYYHFNKCDNYFLDFHYRLTIPKYRANLEIRWNNILNTNNYILYQASSSTVWVSEYTLRPSQFMFSLRFRF